MRKKNPFDTTKLIDIAIKKDLKWDPEKVRCEELSDGNVNYLFRLINKDTRESVVIKIADSVTRMRPDGSISKKRNLLEARYLMRLNVALNGLEDQVSILKTPKVISISDSKHYFLMEDVVPSISLRQALMDGVMPEDLGFRFATFIAISQIPYVGLIDRSHFNTELDFLPINDDLIKITEDLVFTHPFFDKRGRNLYTKGNEEFLHNEITNDKRLRFISARLLDKFKTQKQTLIHGDLHTGSVLVRFNGEKVIGKLSNNMDMFVIDPEFSTLAPIAYDIGNVIAHLFIADVYNMIKYNADSKKRRYMHSYILKQINTLVSTFTDFSYSILKDEIENPLYKSERFVVKYIEDIVNDAWKFAGLEMIRRVVGSAKVPELTSITDIETRIKMERIIIKDAKKIIFSNNKD
ncbi:MAG: phosphotransferase [Treponema sp.]